MSRGREHPHPESLYYHIAVQALQKADGVSSEAADDAEFARKGFVSTAFVFSALCLESFINQQYALQTPDLVESTERLSLEDKWLLLPRLLGAAETLDKSREPFQTFHRLIATRNKRMVHFKPTKETRESGKELKWEYWGELVNDAALARKFVECVSAMIHELKRVTGGRTDVPAFLSGAKYTGTVESEHTLRLDVMDPPPRL